MKKAVSTTKARASRRAAPRGSANRFHIDVRSETFTVGDIEWAQILLTLNLLLQGRWPHVEAYLEELPNAPRQTAARSDASLHADVGRQNQEGA